MVVIVVVVVVVVVVDGKYVLHLFHVSPLRRTSPDVPCLLIPSSPNLRSISVPRQ